MAKLTADKKNREPKTDLGLPEQPKHPCRTPVMREMPRPARRKWSITEN